MDENTGEWLNQNPILVFAWPLPYSLEHTIAIVYLG
jgi:hypothetical protein